MSRDRASIADEPTFGALLRTIVKPRSTSLASGETLFHRGDNVRRFFVVTEGRVRLVRHLADGRIVVLQTARRGDAVAEASLFSKTYHCDAMAETYSHVDVFDCKDVLHALDESSVLGRSFSRRLAAEVQGLRGSLELRNIKLARDRILTYFELVSEDGRIVLDRPLKELAAEIGLSHEVLYRTLAKLEKEGLIERERSEIRLARSSGGSM